MKSELTKAFRVRNKEGKYATLNGEYVHFVAGRGKLCVGEEVLFSFLGDLREYCRLFAWEGKYEDLVVEEYDLTLTNTSPMKYWDEKAEAFFDAKEQKRKEKEARAEAAFDKKYAGAIDPPKMKT